MYLRNEDARGNWFAGVKNSLLGGFPPKWAFRSRRPRKNDDVARVVFRRFMLKMKVSLETSSRKWDSRNSSNIQKWPFRSRRLRKNDDVARVVLRRFMLKMRVSLETSSKK